MNFLVVLTFHYSEQFKLDLNQRFYLPSANTSSFQCQRTCFVSQPHDEKENNNLLTLLKK